MTVNIVIAGIPGTGKSSLVEELKLVPSLADRFEFVNLGKLAVEEGCIESYDEALESHVIDDDKLDELINRTLDGRKSRIIESIHTDHFPAEKVDWVFVCRAETKNIYDRLKARGYNEAKISNNVESEIFQIISDETIDCFGPSKVTELTNNEPDDLKRNAALVRDRIEQLLSLSQ